MLCILGILLVIFIFFFVWLFGLFYLTNIGKFFHFLAFPYFFQQESSYTSSSIFPTVFSLWRRDLLPLYLKNVIHVRKSLVTFSRAYSACHQNRFSFIVSKILFSLSHDHGYKYSVYFFSQPLRLAWLYRQTNIHILLVDSRGGTEEQKPSFFCYFSSMCYIFLFLPFQNLCSLPVHTDFINNKFVFIPELWWELLIMIQGNPMLW